MTTTRQMPSLAERAAAAFGAERARIEQKASAAEQDRLVRARAGLRAAIGRNLDWPGDIDVIEVEARVAKRGTDDDVVDYVAVVEGLTFMIDDDDPFGEGLQLLVACSRQCGRDLWVPVDNLAQLGKALAEPQQHDFDCTASHAPVDPDSVAYDMARDAIDELKDAAEACAMAFDLVTELEDARALIKPAAIKRLIDSGAAASATAAEKIVEQDAEYAAHRMKQREAEISKWRRLGQWEAAKRTATLHTHLVGGRD